MNHVKNSIKDIIEFLNGFKHMISDLCTKGKRVKQIPNLLTLSRVGFALIIPPIAISGGLPAAAALTVCAALTDAVDGFVARKLDAVSEFGKNLDPVCDKIFAGLLLLPLIGKVSPLLSLGLCTNVALELGIAGVNLKSKAKGNVPRTSILGKIKTGVLSALIASLYISFSYQAIASIIPIIYGLAVATQTIALINYNQIDKKKDIQKKAFKSDTSMTTEDIDDTTPNKTKAKEDKTISDDKTVNYSSEDFRNLREEVIRTRKPDNTVIISQDNFQKTK